MTRSSAAYEPGDIRESTALAWSAGSIASGDIRESTALAWSAGSIAPSDIRETTAVSRASRAAKRSAAGKGFIIDVEEALQIRTGKPAPEAI
ncbi:hypothetical protein MBEHAL_0019 [Halarchaeum acidiphilum MH1-52-1]|uniref:Uncharacterized protein n=1 Tax=Halarchaeum acidiphilum MH1-52-1 TaxID=1261545 RepID=U3A0T7_9EURY|nr:hypothetical protein [Halarchaeum acidiphilum]GAD51259.1 hypothetical protein MBEHAL_0019 [Halarchaeum acidiphilum MH1-52-1]